VLVKVPRVQSTELPSASTSDGYGGLSMGGLLGYYNTESLIIVGNVFEVCNRLERRHLILFFVINLALILDFLTLLDNIISVHHR
jgi:hypothetical protein